MEASILLAKVIGIFAITKGIVLLFKKKDVQKAVDSLIDNHNATLFLGAIEFIIALFFVNLHNVWEGGYQIIITVIAWLMLIDGLGAMLFPHRTVVKIYKAINKPMFYNVGILLSLVLGVYLTYLGFGA